MRFRIYKKIKIIPAPFLRGKTRKSSRHAIAIVAIPNLSKIAKLKNAGNDRPDGNLNASFDGEQFKCAIRALLLFFGVLLLLLLVAWFGD